MYSIWNIKNKKIIERSLEVKLPRIWTDEKQRWEESEKRREEESERVRRKKIQVREKVGKSQNTMFFPMICGSGGSKSRPDEGWEITRRSGAKHISKSKCTKHLSFGSLLEVAMSKKCTPLWRSAHFEVKMYKTHQVRQELVEIPPHQSRNQWAPYAWHAGPCSPQ